MPATTRTIKHGVLKFKDGGSNVLTLSKLDGGISGADVFDRDVMAILDRGEPVEFVNLDTGILNFSLTAQFSEFYGESAGAVASPSSLKMWEFALNDKNNASITLTKVDTSMDPFNINVELTKSNPVGSGSEVITWQKAVVVKATFDEGYPDKVHFQFKALAKNITSTVTS